MKQADVSFVNSPLVGKNANKILKHFNDYNFVDDHGHRLELCEDFIELVRLASQYKTECPSQGAFVSALNDGG